MAWILGTAGHIDHGKTSLVKALTGRDTDRLKEEKERGISIDLGFASMELPGVGRIGVVDVPGHERFIRNMLAGAHGIDLVVFAVAADDGVMPQTEEHLDIVHLLGVSRGIFVITKTDLVTVRRVDEVAQAIRSLARGTALETAPIQPCSVVSGEGLDQLRQLIATSVRDVERPRGSGFFRLPIDRAFSAQGHGLVVTGTAITGRLELGARVRCLPGDHLLRVRGIQVHDEAVTLAVAGQRVALNLGGLDKSDKATIVRGDVICDERLTRTTQRFDARLEIRSGGAAGLKSHQRIRVHLGTAERLGSVVPIDAGAPESSGTIYGQITVSEPLQVMRGDRFIIRDETARHTLGGGAVVDPWAAPVRRRDQRRRHRLAALEAPSLAAVMQAYVEESATCVVPWSQLRELLNDDRTTLPEVPGVRVFESDGEPGYAAHSRLRAVESKLADVLTHFHATHPLAFGIDVEEARAAMPERLSTRVFRELIDALETAGTVARQGNLLRSGGHQVCFTERDQALAGQVEQALMAHPLAPPEIGELQTSLGVERQRLSDILRVMEQGGLITRVAPTMYFWRTAIDDLRDQLRARLGGGGTITAAELRDQLKTSRKFAIPLLEYFDRTGVTVRVGDARKLRQPLERTSA